MVKSIIIKKNGGPEVLEIQDVKIKSPGPDEIKVTNLAIGLNYIDTYHRSGLYPLPLPSGIVVTGCRGLPACLAAPQRSVSPPRQHIRFG